MNTQAPITTRRQNPRLSCSAPSRSGGRGFANLFDVGAVHDLVHWCYLFVGLQLRSAQ